MVAAFIGTCRRATDRRLIRKIFLPGRTAMSRASLFAVSALIVLGFARISVAQTETDSFQQGSGPFTPTYTVPSGDLLQGLTPTVVSPNAGAFQQEGAGGVGVLTDGQFGTISGGLASNGTANNSEFATAGSSGGGASVTYTLASP